MKLKNIPYLFSICKLKDTSKVDLSKEYTFLSVTDEEISLVCKTEDVPDNVTEQEDQYRAYRIDGTLDFSLIGIISDITNVLAECSVPVFTISTFNTDYFLIKNKYCIKAVLALRSRGYDI